MKNKDLIDKLQGLDPEAEVVVGDDQTGIDYIVQFPSNGEIWLY